MITTKALLYNYRNGNYQVLLMSDGTKIRQHTGNPQLVVPESLDVKITDWCDGACYYCHEGSTTSGQHGDLLSGVELLRRLPAGVEVAIGGGNPLEHPQLVYFLEQLAAAGLVASLTVNQQHLRYYECSLREWLDSKLIHGLGISYQGGGIPYILRGPNTVIHLILGIHTPDDFKYILDYQPDAKILLLGFKQFGRASRLVPHLSKWRNYARELLSYGGSVAAATVAFDNLAITQLGIKELLSLKEWQNYYMGDDGQFTMYLDLVRREYAASSTSRRYPIEGSIKEMFSYVRQGSA